MEILNIFTLQQRPSIRSVACSIAKNQTQILVIPLFVCALEYNMAGAHPKNQNGFVIMMSNAIIWVKHQQKHSLRHDKILANHFEENQHLSIG
jgi:hypothetical protein